MENPVIERLARAACLADCLKHGKAEQPVVQKYVNGAWPAYRHMIAPILTALREPGAEAVAAAADSNPDFFISEGIVAEAFVRVIDHILSHPSKTEAAA